MLYLSPSVQGFREVDGFAGLPAAHPVAQQPFAVILGQPVVDRLYLMPQRPDLELRDLFLGQVRRRFLRFSFIGDQGQLDVVDLRQAVHQSGQIADGAFPSAIFLVVDVRRQRLDDVYDALVKRKGD